MYMIAWLKDSVDHFTVCKEITAKCKGSSPSLPLPLTKPLKQMDWVLPKIIQHTMLWYSVWCRQLIIHHHTVEWWYNKDTDICASAADVMSCCPIFVFSLLRGSESRGAKGKERGAFSSGLPNMMRGSAPPQCPPLRHWLHTNPLTLIPEAWTLLKQPCQLQVSC